MIQKYFLYLICSKNAFVLVIGRMQYAPTALRISFKANFHISIFAHLHICLNFPIFQFSNVAIPNFAA